MTEEVYYKKVGRRYVPVSYYNSEVMDAVPLGAHLIVKRSGVTSRRDQVDPAFAPMIAAGFYAEDAISSTIVKASEARPSKISITQEEADAWENLKKVMGNDVCYIQYPSAADATRAGVKAMQAEAEKLLSNPAVKEAYDHFMLMCKICYNENTN